MNINHYRVSKYLIRRGVHVQAWVDPFTIIYPKRRKDWPRYVKSWPLLACPGTWDRYSELYPPFREAELRAVLLEGQDYEATETFCRLTADLERDGRTRFPRCHSLDEIHAYFRDLWSLHDSMKTHGYCPSTDTNAEGEVMVRISRYGELLKCGQGTHRLAMARILKVRKVLISVDLVESRWLDHCIGTYRCPPLGALGKWLETLQPPWH